MTYITIEQMNTTPDFTVRGYDRAFIRLFGQEMELTRENLIKWWKDSSAPFYDNAVNLNLITDENKRKQFLQSSIFMDLAGNFIELYESCHKKSLVDKIVEQCR